MEQMHIEILKLSWEELYLFYPLTTQKDTFKHLTRNAED